MRRLTVIALALGGGLILMGATRVSAQAADPTVCRPFAAELPAARTAEQKRALLARTPGLCARLRQQINAALAAPPVPIKTKEKAAPNTAATASKTGSALANAPPPPVDCRPTEQAIRKLASEDATKAQWDALRAGAPAACVSTTYSGFGRLLESAAGCVDKNAAAKLESASADALDLMRRNLSNDCVFAQNVIDRRRETMATTLEIARARSVLDAIGPDRWLSVEWDNKHIRLRDMMWREVRELPMVSVRHWATLGEPKALIALGYRRLVDPELSGHTPTSESIRDGMTAWSRAARAGNPRAAYALATNLTRYGAQAGVDASAPERARLLALAANGGVTLAYVPMGLMHEKGEGGLAASDAQALSYYRRGASAKRCDGYANLARFTWLGKGGLRRDARAAFLIASGSAVRSCDQTKAVLGLMHLASAAPFSMQYFGGGLEPDRAQNSPYDRYNSAEGLARQSFCDARTVPIADVHCARLNETSAISDAVATYQRWASRADEPEARAVARERLTALGIGAPAQ